MLMLMQAAAEADRLTLAKVLRDIPHDAPAIVVYVMVAIFAGLVWMGSRKKAT